MRIVLIGFMGSGKSSVGQELAALTGYPLAEMDQLICTRCGIASIPTIFAEHGEHYFRSLEQEVAHSLLKEQKLIISSGGGVVAYPETMRYLQSSGSKIIYLKTNFEEVLTRLNEVNAREQRPLFSSEEQLHSLFVARTPLYEHYAHWIVETGEKEPKTIAKEILQQLAAS